MLYPMLRTPFERVDEGLPRLPQAKAILPVHVVRVRIILNGLPDLPVSMFCGEDSGVLELNAVPQVDAVFGHGGFFWILQTDVALVLLNPGLVGTAGLPDVDLITLTGHAVHTRSLESQVIFHRQK
jgi:hypothetical protein